MFGLYDLYYENYVKLGEMKETLEQQYTVVKNDSLCKIAKKFFGDAGKWEKIYNDNKEQINDPNVLMIGQKLKINLY